MRISALLLAILLGARAQADLILNVESVRVEAGGSGAFEVFLTSTDGVFPDIAGHQIRLTVPEDSGIEFTSAGVTTVRPYVGPSSAPLREFKVPQSSILVISTFSVTRHLRSTWPEFFVWSLRQPRIFK